MSRGSGRTKDELIEAIGLVQQGKNVAFVMGTSNEIRYTFDLCAFLIPADHRVHRGFAFMIGNAVLKIVSLSNSPETILGWNGLVKFDHAAFRAETWTHSRNKWVEYAHGCNIRHHI